MSSNRGVAKIEGGKSFLKGGGGGGRSSLSSHPPPPPCCSFYSKLLKNVVFFQVFILLASTLYTRTLLDQKFIGETCPLPLPYATGLVLLAQNLVNSKKVNDIKCRSYTG